MACHFAEIVKGLAIDVEAAHAVAEGVDLSSLSAPEPIIVPDRSPEPVIEPDPIETAAGG